MRLEPWHFLILIVIALLLFGAPRLPGLARSMGQSLRIFKSEVKQMKNDDNDTTSDSEASPVQGRIVDGRKPGTDPAHPGEPTPSETEAPRTMAAEQEPGHRATGHSATGHSETDNRATETSATEDSAAGPARTAGKPPSGTP